MFMEQYNFYKKVLIKAGSLSSYRDVIASKSILLSISTILTYNASWLMISPNTMQHEI